MKTKKIFGILIFVVASLTVMKTRANDLTDREENIILSEFAGVCIDTWCEILGSDEFEFHRFTCSFRRDACAVEWSVSFDLERDGKTISGSVAHTCILEIPSKERLFDEGRLSHFAVKKAHRCFLKILDSILQGNF